MAQPATNAKIEELRFRLKLDAKSRLFYPLAEELRKVSEYVEAEQVLRTGLTNHATYLSAWVSLGRVLLEQHKNAEAVEALTRALQLDPGNVVAARLLADAHLAVGDKIEAIKKYKLVHALLPADETLEGVIAQLDAEINGPATPAATAPVTQQPDLVSPEPPPVVAVDDDAPFGAAEVVAEPEPAPPAPSRPRIDGDATLDMPPRIPSGYQPTIEKPFDESDVPIVTPEESPWMATVEEPATEPTPWGAPPAEDLFVQPDVIVDTREEEATGDAEPMRAAHADSPFEEPAADFGYNADAFAVENPGGMHVTRAPLVADVPMVAAEEELPSEAAPPISPEPRFVPQEIAEPADVFAPSTDADSWGADPFAATTPSGPAVSDDFAKTITMADLYANQGLLDEARDIYEDILARDPGHAVVRAKLEALSATPPADAKPAPAGGDKIGKLQKWLTKVAAERSNV